MCRILPYGPGWALAPVPGPVLVLAAVMILGLARHLDISRFSAAGRLQDPTMVPVLVQVLVTSHRIVSGPASAKPASLKTMDSGLDLPHGPGQHPGRQSIRGPGTVSVSTVEFRHLLSDNELHQGEEIPILW